VRKFGRQAASALAAAHARGIVHRDIKPSNLMVTPDGDLKVMDFGVARRSGDTQLTMEGGLVGTANIMAPEIVRGEGAGPEADLFSLGCVLYEALAGRPAFEGDDPMAVLFQVVNREPTPLAELRPDTPPELAEVVHGLLVKTPAERFGPAGEVAARMGGEVESVPADATMALGGGDRTLVLGAEKGEGASAAGERPGPAWRHPRVWGTAVAVLVLAAAGWLVLRPTGPSAEELAQARAHSARGMAFLERRNADSAAVYFTKSLELAPSDTTYDNLALAATWMRKPADAERYAREALALDPGFARARVRLGDALTDQGRYAEAEEQYRWAFRDANAASDTSVFVSAANNLGSLFLKTDRPDSTIAWLVPLLGDFPVPAILKNYGLAWRDRGDTGLARATLEQARSVAIEAKAEGVQKEVEAALLALPDSLGLRETVEN
jgi:Flp pilus assembly protein TadD